METLAGRYRLIERLGAGGMSVVYRGHDEVLERPVAVKVLAVEWAADREFRARMRREALAAAKLSHPHITEVYDFGETRDGRPYVVMELIDGPTLAHRMTTGGPVPWPTAVRIAAQVASALAAAHAKGLVHRDVTPANVMLSRTGVKVVDFGIAAVAGERDTSVLGTPSYLAPEQRAGGPAQAATDVYALGLLLYHATTGQLPRPPHLPGVPRDGAAVIAACLRADPAERPSSAALSRMLTDLAEGRAIRIPVLTPSTSRVMPTPPRTDPVQTGTRSLAGTGAMGGTRVMPVPAGGLRRASRRATPAGFVVQRPRRWSWVVSGAVVVVLTFLAGVVLASSRQDAGTPGAATTSPPPSPTPPGGLCAVSYKVTVSVGGGFSADVVIRNTAQQPISGWSLVFDLPGQQTVRFGWAGQWGQNGRTVTVHDLIYNARIDPGKTTAVGFVGLKGDAVKPTRFTLNGMPCKAV